MPNNLVTISAEEYQELTDARLWLTALQHAGVDNWEGHDIAVDIYDGFKLEQNKPEVATEGGKENNG